METLESSRVCRLCGKQSGISINIFDKNENHVKKINAILPVMVHEMDLLPKHMCHRCSYKLEEFHKFYVDCLKTDADLKSQLSWMRKEDSNERIGVPMVHIENVKIKLEPPDFDVYEMSPIVNDVKYINSMSSVSFPVNGVQPNDISDGITYTAYTGCSCYCDKTDQSNQTVCANYKNTIPRCNRLKNVRSGNDRRFNDLQAVKKDVLPNESCKKRTNLPTLINEVKNMKRDISSVNEDVSKGSIVRNLRPRKGFIDYTGMNRMHPVVSSKNSDRSKDATTKMSTPLTRLSIAQIKIEKLDHVEGRILRPRKGTIDYMGPRRRKLSKSTVKNQRSPGDKYRSVNEHKVRNIANKLKVPTSTMPMLLENTIKLAIKQEHLSDPEDTLVFRESVSTILSKNHEDSSTRDIVNKMDSLPNDCITNVQNDRVDSSTLKQEQYDDNYSVTNQWKSVNKLRKIDLNRISTTGYSSKYLRSQNLYLRSGKIKELDNRKLSRRNLRSLRSVMDSGRAVKRNLMKTVQGETRTRKMSASLIDNIKHYCEECNISFVNRELFKLHTCYR